MYAQVLTALLLFIFPLSILPFQGTAFSLTSLLTLSAPAAVPGLKGPHIIIVTYCNWDELALALALAWLRGPLGNRVGNCEGGGGGGACLWAKST